MEQWLSTKEVSDLLDITEQAVRKQAASGKYGEIRYETSSNGGGVDGKALRIPLGSLPTEAQVAYLRGYGQGIQHVVVDDSEEWDGSPLWAREVAEERMAILAAWDRYVAANPDKSKTEATEDFIRTWQVLSDENKLSMGTLYRWRRAYREGDRCALLPRWGRLAKDNRRGQRGIDPEAFGVFMKMYGTLQQRTIADCYRDLVLIAADKGWRVPSLRTMQRLIEENVRADTLIYLREGPEAWQQKCAPYILRDMEAIRGCEVWVGDQHRLDFFCKGPNGKPVRPWLTAWIDFRSTKLLGWYIGYANNTDTIMAAFERAATNPAIGLPNDIYIDNGRDYSSYEFAGRGHRRERKEKVDEARVRSLVVHLGIAPHFAIPRNARAKTIERDFRIVAEQFSKRFETWCGSNNEEKPAGLDELLKDLNRVPSLEEVRELFDGWVVHMYNKNPSQGEGRKGECPDETFQRTRGPIRLAPSSALRLCLMRHTQPLVVRRSGITFMGQRYMNPELVAHEGEKVYLRYRDDDMSRVHVFTLDDEYLMDVELQGRVAAMGATKEDFRKARSMEKEALRITRQAAEMREAVGLEPDTLARAIERRAQDPNRPPDPETPNVIEPVRISHQLREAAKAMEMAQAVGDDTNRYQDTFKQLFAPSSSRETQDEDKAGRAISILRSIQNK